MLAPQDAGGEKQGGGQGGRQNGRADKGQGCHHPGGDLRKHGKRVGEKLADQDDRHNGEEDHQQHDDPAFIDPELIEDREEDRHENQGGHQGADEAEQHVVESGVPFDQLHHRADAGGQQAAEQPQQQAGGVPGENHLHGGQRRGGHQLIEAVLFIVGEAVDGQHEADDSHEGAHAGRPVPDAGKDGDHQHNIHDKKFSLSADEGQILIYQAFHDRPPFFFLV